MGHTIEPAKSARASCKTCKAKIEKGELRLGEEAPNPFMNGEMGYRWHHLKCGAKKKASVLLEAMDNVDIEIPDREELLKLVEGSKKKEKPTKCPFAEYASTGRSSCFECKEKIEKGDLRISVYIESEDMGGFGRKAFVHPQCIEPYKNGSDEEILEEIKTNSFNLEESDFSKLEAILNS